MYISRKIQRLIYIVKKRCVLKIDSHSYKLHRYGNHYGGFMVFDKDLKKKKNAVVYSFGIGEDLSFSEDILSSLSAEIFAFDPTPKAIEYVKKHRLYGNENFHFEDIGLSDKDETEKFYVTTKDAKDISGSIIQRDELIKEGIDVEMQCIPTIAARFGHKHIDILKMDVEGSEFKVIENLDWTAWDHTIDQICLEVHDRFLDDGIERLKKCVNTLKSSGYLLVYISFKGDELTFIKKEIDV